MKRLLFISMIGLFAVSCQPAEFTCDCTGTGGGSVTVSGGLSLIDTNLIGHWKQTNVNNPNDTNQIFWEDGQIDLHFFADGTWDIDGESGTGELSSDAGTYKIHSNNCIDLGTRVFNYSINNDVLTFSPVPGQDYIWIMEFNGGSIIGKPNNLSYYPYAEINNLTKQ